MNILVTGGSGFVGGHLIERLVADGHTVRALARSDRSASIVEAFGATSAHGSLGTVDADAVSGCSAVIHAAARAEDWGTREQFESVNVEGTRQLLEVAQANGVSRFVHVGTEAALFVGDDLVNIDESLPLPDQHRFLYSETKAAAERLVLAANSPGFHTVSIRPRFVWGPRDASVLPTLLEMLEKGGFWWMDGGRPVTSTCHVGNLVQALVLALTSGKGGRPYFITDGEDRTMHDVLTSLASTRGVTLPDRNLPGWLGRAAAAVIEPTWSMLGWGRPPMSRMAMAMLSATVTVQDAAAREDLGYAPIVTFDEGVCAMQVTALDPTDCSVSQHD